MKNFELKNQLRYMQFITLLVLLSFADISVVFADDAKAVGFYRSAEKQFESGNLNKALTLYQKALEWRDADGEIIVQKNIEKRIVSLGRSAKEVTVDNSIKLLYEPNKKISLINSLIKKKYKKKHPPRLLLKWMTLKDPSRDDIFDGGETASIIFEIKNTGQSEAVEVVLTSTVDNIQGLTFKETLTIGDISPQEARSVILDVNVSRDAIDNVRNFVAKATEESGVESNQSKVIVRTRPHRPEKVVLSNLNIIDFNRDGKVEPTESVTVGAKLMNVGQGSSESLNLHLSAGENVFLLPETKQDLEIGKMYPGDAVNFSFSFVTNNEFRNNQKIPLVISVRDNAGTELVKKDIGIATFIPTGKKYGDSVSQIDNNNLLSESAAKDDPLIVKTQSVDRYSVAVVIGNTEYHTAGVPQVKYAGNDARAIRDMLINSFGYQEKNILFLQDATSARFFETFGTTDNYAGRLYDYVEPGKSNVFIYYSGHGAQDLKNRNAYFVPVDANPNYLASSGYSLSLFYKNIKKLPARNLIVVLDTCFSGNTAGGFLYKNISPLRLEIRNILPKIDNAVIFTSSSSDQVSAWYDDKRHGLYTYYFLQGISGLADENNDKMISTLELNKYVLNNVPHKARRLNGTEQTPSLSQTQQFILVDYTAQQKLSSIRRIPK